MATTSIEWTEKTWNPVRGCSRISPGCQHCYAELMAHRFSGPGKPYEGLTKLTSDGPRWTGKISLVPEMLGEPLKLRKPSFIFVNSMSDLFHEDIPFEYVDRVFAVMASASQHVFQVLTKRPARMLEYMNRITRLAPTALTDYLTRQREHFERYKRRVVEGHTFPEPPTAELRFIYDSAALQENRPTRPSGNVLGDRSGFSGGEYHWRSWPLDNVWLGVSVENQKTADTRIPLLLDTPAAIHWVSAEPLLGPIDLNNYLYTRYIAGGARHMYNQLDWVVAGGESGPGARPSHPDWFRTMRHQCATANVKFFFKQWGAFQYDNRMFTTFQNWVNKANTWIGGTGALCVDMTGKVLERGADFQSAEYPIAIAYRVGKKAAGRLLDGETCEQYPTPTSINS